MLVSSSGCFNRFQGIWLDQTDIPAGKHSGGPHSLLPAPPASFQVNTRRHGEATQGKCREAAVSFHTCPETSPLLIADMPVVCLVSIIILKIPLFSLLGMKSCSYKGDLQNKTKFHYQLKGPRQAFQPWVVRLTSYHLSESQCIHILNKVKRSQAWWHTPVIPALWEAEAVRAM